MRNFSEFPGRAFIPDEAFSSILKQAMFAYSEPQRKSARSVA
jgi:hypothetical protein